MRTVVYAQKEIGCKLHQAYVCFRLVAIKLQTSCCNWKSAYMHTGVTISKRLPIQHTLNFVNTV